MFPCFLGRIAARINRRMPAIHESLQRLLDDPDDAVRRAAQKAIADLTGQA